MYALIHTHGIGDIDYSSMLPTDLADVERQAREAGVYVVPCIFLARDYIDTLESVLRAYDDAKDAYAHILGFSVEGPLLGRSGGVPPRGIWQPTDNEWRRIANMGPLGLRYVVIGPDGGELDDAVGDITLGEVIDILYSNGVRAALGHFSHDDAATSARRTRAVIDHIRSHFGEEQSLILTDHLYNDMPSKFRHAWRTPEQQVYRDDELAPIVAADWNTTELTSLLGPVPATLLDAARAGEVLPFLNFDGDHVDLEICRKTVEYLTPDNLIGITDDTPVPVLAGEVLHQLNGQGLWYRSNGIVAAGSVSWHQQLQNLESIGVDADGQRAIFAENPLRALVPTGTLKRQ